MMNIKQVEKLTGISSQNIRFCEKSGLIHPKRNEENGYREYNEEDIRLLKLVKMFRMLDMPIEQIKLMLCETDELDNLLGKQEKVLEKKLANTKCAIDLCENLRKTHKTIADIDVDSYRMLLLIFLVGTASLKTLFFTMEGAIILIAMLVLCVAMSIRNYFFYWNRSDA